MSDSKKKPDSKKKLVKKTVKTTKISPNKKWLIIVESPSKCSKIESFLGDEYLCIASKGHIRNIDNLKSIDFSNNCKTEYSLIQEKKDHVESMKNIVSQFPKENILIATDDDREGEGIGWHLCSVFNLDIHTTKRIIFREITKPAIVNAVKNPGLLNIPLVNASNCRQILDMIIGFKISPVLWKHVFRNSENSLSAGRCQTPALRLVYDKFNDDKIREIKKVYKVTASFFSYNGGILFDLNHSFERIEEIEDFLSKSINHKYILSLEKKENKSKNSPKPFNTSNLLQRVSSQLQYSPKETMTLCQQLYQDGHITYMRTDSMQYSGVFLEEASDFIINKYGDKFLGDISKIKNTDIINPHEAIRVTHIDVESVGYDNTRLVNLYKFIWKNTVESCMSDYEYSLHKVTITAPLDLKYGYLNEIPIFLGWRLIETKGQETKGQETKGDSNSLEFYLKSIKSEIKYNYIQSTVSITNTDKHYTEATLIKALEDRGIGRPSTFASIVDTIQERGYVKLIDLEGRVEKVKEYKLRGSTLEIEESEKIFGREKNKLVIQDIGIIVCEFLVENFTDLFSYDYTKLLEEELDKIANKTGRIWYDLCIDSANSIDSLLKTINIQKQQYRIDDEHSLVYEKFGAVIRREIKEIRETREKKEIREKKPNYEYLSIRKDIKIDIEKLKSGEYTLSDLLDIKERSLGKYQRNRQINNGENSIEKNSIEEIEIILKSGKFGYYLEIVIIDTELDEKNPEENRINERISIADFIKKYTKEGKDINNLSISDIKQFIDNDFRNENPIEKKNTNILRELTPYLSIRKGKYGAYIFYKTEKMVKPQFFKLNNFKQSFTLCKEETILEWIKATYNILEI
jgi:DNA topoisomerase-1